jgi:hypothetical protein
MMLVQNKTKEKRSVLGSIARRLVSRFSKNGEAEVVVKEKFDEEATVEKYGLNTIDEIKQKEWDERTYDQTNQRLFLTESLASKNLAVEADREVFPINNPRLAFEFRKKWIELKKKAKKRPKVDVKPKLVYHGTSSEAARCIAEGGFKIPQEDRSIAVKNGAAYGIGVYCSPSLSTAQDYAGGVILVCVALTGLMTTTKMRMKIKSSYKYDSYMSGSYWVIHDKFAILPLYFFKFPNYDDY